MVVIVGYKPSSKNTDPNVAFVGTPSYTRLLRIMEKAGVDGVTLCNAYDANDQPLNIPKAIKYVALGTHAAARLDELGLQCLKLPHPSGRNRVWNEEGMEDKVAQQLKDFLAE